ncbi:MAG: MFS transporter [Ottowia sp.]
MTSGTTQVAREQAARRAIRGGVVGNYVDQFDIFLPVIALVPAAAALFGPEHAGANTGLVFVATLLGRPLGSIIFGPMADRLGRTRVTKIALLGIFATTLGIALVPDFHTLGIWTLWLIALLRFLGGVFLGGEYSAAIPLALEWTPQRRRGLVSGLVMSMSPCANASIAALTALLYAVLGADGYARWGWRALFCLGALLALALFFYYQRHVRDAPVQRSESARRAEARPLAQLFSGRSRYAFMGVFILMSGLWIMTNMAVVVLTRALSTQAQLPAQRVTLVMFAATLLSAPAMLLAGHASTFVGRRRFFIAFGLASAVLAPLLYALVPVVPSLAAVVAAACALQWATVAGYGPVGAHLVEQFPSRVRSSGYGIGYSVSIVLPALFPYYLPWLQRATGPVAAVALLLALAGLLVCTGGWLARANGQVNGTRQAT